MFFTLISDLTTVEQFSPRITHFIDYLSAKKITENGEIEAEYEMLPNRKKIEAVLILYKFKIIDFAAKVFDQIPLQLKEKCFEPIVYNQLNQELQKQGKILQHMLQNHIKLMRRCYVCLFTVGKVVKIRIIFVFC